jgi:catechol 2,3-dioxygenase-like lactoylglutathione lyase family enzyme
MPELHLDNVGVVTEDLDASLAFYTRALGFELIERDHELGQACVRLGGTVLFLLATTGGPGPVRTADPAANPAGVDHLSFATADVDATYRALTGLGVEFFLPPHDADWGARVCGCRDPAGTPIYFLRWASRG